jgi:regulator of replication initiation timing
MSDRLDVLEKKIEEALLRLEQLQDENTRLKAENKALKTELARLKKESQKLVLQDKDRAETVKNKLVMVLKRLDQLESLYA